MWLLVRHPGERRDPCLGARCPVAIATSMHNDVGVRGLTPTYAGCEILTHVVVGSSSRRTPTSVREAVAGEVKKVVAGQGVLGKNPERQLNTRTRNDVQHKPIWGVTAAGAARAL